VTRRRLVGGGVLVLACIVAAAVAGLGVSGISLGDRGRPVIDGQTYDDTCNGINEGSACLGPDTLALTSDGKGGFVLVYDGEFRATEPGLWARRLNARGEPAGDVRLLERVTDIGPPIDVVAGLRRGRVVVQRDGRELVLDDALRVVRRGRRARAVKPAGVTVRVDSVGLRDFVLPGDPGTAIYVDGEDKRIHAASCEDVDCPRS